MRARVKRNNLKFGIQVPRDITEAYDLDQENRNNLWHEAIEKEKKNVIIAFKLLEDDEFPTPGSTEIPFLFCI